jgi:transcription initiation factor IIF auxiliary subunit
MRRLFAFAGVLLNAALLASAQNVTIDNTAKYAGNGRYSWTVFVKGDAKSLAQIGSVQYTLHPTFQNPVVFGKGANFSYSAVGWGEFNIVAKISYKDKRAPTTINYWLRLFPRNKASTQAVQQKR